MIDSVVLLLLSVAGAAAHGAPMAYFLLAFDDVDGPDWPQKFENYSLFVASPTHFTASHVKKVHDTIPGSRVLAYMDTIDVALKYGCSTGSPMGNLPIQRRLPDDPDGYYKQLRQGFKHEWLMRNLSDNGAPVCYFPGLAAMCMMKESADFLVRFHKQVTIDEYNFDGIYQDMLDANYYWLGHDFTTIDSDGDGKPNTAKDIGAQWHGWRNYYIKELRAAVGDDKIIVASCVSERGSNAPRMC